MIAVEEARADTAISRNETSLRSSEREIQLTIKRWQSPSNNTQIYNGSCCSQGSVVAETSFTIPFSSVLQREIEMKSIAIKFGINTDRWNGSLIFSKWKESGMFSFVFQPEDDCALFICRNGIRPDPVTQTQAATTSHWWEDWLTEMIETYYRSGKIHVPSRARGFDLLLAIEFFGILYQPDQLVFDSYDSFICVKQWSNYYMHRATLAEWVVAYFLKHMSSESSEELIQQTLVATSFSEQLENIYVGSMKLPVLMDGNLDYTKHVSPILFDFFNGADNSTTDGAISKETAAIMRVDFSVCLENLISSHLKCTVRFPTMAVHLGTAQEPNIDSMKRCVNRAILVIEPFDPSNQESAQNKAELIEREKPTKNMIMKGTNGTDDLVNAFVPDVNNDSIKDRKLNQNLEKSNGPNDNMTFTDSSSRSKCEQEEAYSIGGGSAPARLQSSTVIVALDESCLPTTSMTPNSGSKKYKYDAFLSQTRVACSGNSTGKKADVVQVSKNLPSTECESNGPMPPVSVVEAKAYDLLTVPSALTGPYYIDDDGTVQDVFGNESEIEHDIQAQAKRHEWIQDAMLNRGISKRVENLLKTDNKSDNKTDDKGGIFGNSSPWDWIPISGFCDISQKFMESMEGCRITKTWRSDFDDERKSDTISLSGSLVYFDSAAKAAHKVPTETEDETFHQTIANISNTSAQKNFEFSDNLPLDELNTGDKSKSNIKKSAITVKHHLAFLNQLVFEQETKPNVSVIDDACEREKSSIIRFGSQSLHSKHMESVETDSTAPITPMKSSASESSSNPCPRSSGAITLPPTKPKPRETTEPVVHGDDLDNIHHLASKRKSMKLFRIFRRRKEI